MIHSQQLQVAVPTLCLKALETFTKLKFKLFEAFFSFVLPIFALIKNFDNVEVSETAGLDAVRDGHEFDFTTVLSECKFAKGFNGEQI